MIAAHVADGVLTVVDAEGTALLTARGEALLADGQLLSTLVAGSGLEWQVDLRPPAGVVLRLRLRRRTAVRVEQLRPLVSPAGYRALPLDRLRISQTGWQSWSRSHPAAPFEPNFTSAGPPIRGPLLPHRQRTSQVEPWLTILSATDAPPLLLGFLSAQQQLGTLEISPVAHGGHALVAATELDGIGLEPDTDLSSEPLLVALGAEADLLELYATQVQQTMTARPVHDVLTGWCSWYQLYTSVSEADVLRNLDGLAARRSQLPLGLIQLDDGFQREVGDWLELNAKFPSGMPTLTRRIQTAGYLPGLWLAPFLLSARSHTYAAHPDWVVRDADGEPLNALDNWGAPNYALDTTHPAALAWLADVVRTVGEEWGFEYLKLDFLYAAAMRGQRHDPHATGVAAYRRGLELLRQTAGERFVLGCGAPLLPSVGLVDGMRVGSDVAPYWGREGNADGPALRNAMRAVLARGWFHGRWWANDPDCVIVRAHDTELSLDEVEAWAAVVALSGGMVFVGDDVANVEPERLALLARLLPPSGQAARTGPPLEALMPERLHLHVERSWGAWDVVGIANWSDAVREVRFDPADFGLAPDRAYHVVDQWRGAYLGRASGGLELGPLAAHALRLLAVHPDAGRPQVVGSTGHLLGEVLDLAAEDWEQARQVLTIVPSGTGPVDRKGELLVYDPKGPLRRVPFAMAQPIPIDLSF
jgi:alpha-galactosidase